MKGLLWTTTLVHDDELIRHHRASRRLVSAQDPRRRPARGGRHECRGVGARQHRSSARHRAARDSSLAHQESIDHRSRLTRRWRSPPSASAFHRTRSRRWRCRRSVLTDVGVRRESMGDFTAELVVTGTSSTVLRWIKPDGSTQKSVPKSVKDTHADDLKALRADAKDIQKLLPAQRESDRQPLSRPEGMARRDLAGTLSRSPARRHAHAATHLVDRHRRHHRRVPLARRRARRPRRHSRPPSIPPPRAFRLWHPIDHGHRHNRPRGAIVSPTLRSCSHSNRRIARSTVSPTRNVPPRCTPIVTQRTF